MVRVRKQFLYASNCIWLHPWVIFLLQCSLWVSFAILFAYGATILFMGIFLFDHQYAPVKNPRDSLVGETFGSFLISVN